VTSPSFIMIAEYCGRLPLYHIDLYRLDTEQIDPAALREYLYGKGVSAIEWVERLPAGVLTEYLEVQLTCVSPDEREIEIRAKGFRSRLVLDEVLRAV